MKHSQVASDLLVARTFIADKECWTRGSQFRDAYGVPTNANYAHSYCLIGAIRQATGETLDYLLEHNRTRACLSALHLNMRAPSVASWNDATNRTHKQVLALIDKTIERELKG